MVSWQAFPSLPSRALSLTPKTPIPIPFKRLPRMLATLNLSMQAKRGDQIVEP